MTPLSPTPRIHVSEGLRGRVPPRVREELARRVRRASRRMGVRAEALAELGLRLVDDREMARLHLVYMGEPGPTDVLSFEGPSPGSGDIAIDWQAVARQAAGPSPRQILDEATLLAIHGLAHLLGHDHRDRREGRRMHRLELRGLRAARVPDRPRAYTHPSPGRRSS
jgi:probable rRNA maturation factor